MNSQKYLVFAMSIFDTKLDEKTFQNLKHTLLLITPQPLKFGLFRNSTYELFNQLC